MAAVLELQRAAGNAAVAGMLPGMVAAVQRCGPTPCDCSAEERAEHLAGQPREPVAQRDGEGAPGPTGKCGPGTSNPFCLPIPDVNAPCKPFDTVDHALAVWASLSTTVPRAAALVTKCGEVQDVWDAYFDAKSKRFAFSGTSSCVVAGAKNDPVAAATANKAADVLLKDIVDNLPFTLQGVTPPAFPFGPFAVLRMPLETAIGAAPVDHLHPKIAYRGATNPANNIAGGVGEPDGGSDIFGDDDRLMGGDVTIEVAGVDSEGAFTGQVRWVPSVHVIDTADFCPGNLGGTFLRGFTVPMSKLEAQGLTRDVPFTIDYNLDLRKANFKVAPFIGPPPPRPGPIPPSPKPGPTPDPFPRSGPAATTGSLLRIRTGPGLTFPVLGLLGERGTSIGVITQVHGDAVDGNDRWDKIDRGFVSDRFVAFDTDRKTTR